MMTSDAGTTGQSTLTLGSLLASLERVKDALDRFEPAVPPIIAMQESWVAVLHAPRRTHRHRKNQSLAYHKRVQKKWLKRFGAKEVPTAYMLDTSALAPWAARGRILVCHPVIADQMRKRGEWIA